MIQCHAIIDSLAYLLECTTLYDIDCSFQFEQIIHQSQQRFSLHHRPTHLTQLILNHDVIMLNFRPLAMQSHRGCLIYRRV